MDSSTEQRAVKRLAHSPKPFSWKKGGEKMKSHRGHILSSYPAILYKTTVRCLLLFISLNQMTTNPAKDLSRLCIRNGQFRLHPQYSIITQQGCSMGPGGPRALWEVEGEMKALQSG
uniref:Uncharacterized protein n=1 Tax=Anguilla anguilla TaxID=7936 RepID=A0A0E9WJB5_ANGAN